MKKARQILSLVAPLIPLNPMIRVSGQNLIFPLYHAASDNSPVHLRHLYKIRTSKEFEKDIDVLCQYYEPLSPEILNTPGMFNKRSKPGFILSFDDGLREIKEVVEPILSRKGINAIFFLNNAFIDNKAMFFRYKASALCDIILKAPENSLPEFEIAQVLGLNGYDKFKVISAILKVGFAHRVKLNVIAGISGFNISKFLTEVQPYLTSPEILELQKRGYHIGAHSFDHPLFTDLDEEQMMTEVAASLKDIDLRFKPSLKFFAFPFTDGGISSRVINAVFQNHPHAIFGSAGIKKEKQAYHFQRIPFEKYSGSALNILKTEYLYYILKAGFGRNVIKRLK
jgi:peptidoglycan/xylan/chitin deacetylase (PgdA/CDA1 family)